LGAFANSQIPLGGPHPFSRGGGPLFSGEKSQGVFLGRHPFFGGRKNWGVVEKHPRRHNGGGLFAGKKAHTPFFPGERGSKGGGTQQRGFCCGGFGAPIKKLLAAKKRGRTVYKGGRGRSIRGGTQTIDTGVCPVTTTTS